MRTPAPAVERPSARAEGADAEDVRQVLRQRYAHRRCKLLRGIQARLPRHALRRRSRGEEDVNIIPKDGGFEWHVQYGIYSESGWCETEEQGNNVARYCLRQIFFAVHPQNL